MRRLRWAVAVVVVALVGAGMVVAVEPVTDVPIAAASPRLALPAPEDAVREYLAGFADADIERIIAATAVDEVSAGLRFDLFTQRISAFAPNAGYAPSEYPFFAEMTRAAQAAQILSQVRMLAYSLLSETPIGPKVIPGDELDPDPLHWAQDFVRQVDPSRLKGITLVDVIEPDPERMESELVQSLYAQQATPLGADEATERLAIITFEGDSFAVGFTLLRYGDEWRVSYQYSPLGGTDPIGIAMPYTVQE